jgi:hypothetical protein
MVTIGRLHRGKSRAAGVPVPVSHTRAARHWIDEHRAHVPHVRLPHVHMPHGGHAHLPHLPHLPPMKPENSLRHYQFLEAALMSREMDRL